MNSLAIFRPTTFWIT